MSSLLEKTELTMCPGMSVPTEMALLYGWIEQKGFINNGVGHLGYDCPTEIQFMPEGNAHLHHWFGYEDPAVMDRLCVFCRTGGDGSMGAFWLDPEGHQKIVNLGSGSGSTMACVLADHFLDFIKLLALGYEEIGWDSEIEGLPPALAETNPSEFRRWVVQERGIELPTTGTDIVQTIARIGDSNSNDPFNRWIEANER